MNKLLGVLLAAVVVIAGGGIALTLHERDAAVREREEIKLQVVKLQEKEKTLEAALSTSRKEREQARTELKQAEQKIATLTAQVAEVQAKTAAAASAKGGRVVGGGGIGSPASTKPMNALMDMMKNPAMREVLKQQQLAQIDMQYGGLMSRFQLNDEEKANFKQLLAERLQLETDLGMKLMDPSLTAEQRKGLIQQLSDAKSANDSRIKTFLNNDEDYKGYQSWEDTKPERMQLSMGQSLFTNSGEPLSAQQEQQLVDVMAQVRRQPKATPDLSKPENFDPAKLNQAGIDRLLSSYDTDAQKILQAAGGFLSPKQMETLKAMQQQWRAMQEAGLKMSGMMMGEKK